MPACNSGCSRLTSADEKCRGIGISWNLRAVIIDIERWRNCADVMRFLYIIRVYFPYLYIFQNFSIHVKVKKI